MASFLRGSNPRPCPDQCVCACVTKLCLVGLNRCATWQTEFSEWAADASILHRKIASVAGGTHLLSGAAAVPYTSPPAVRACAHALRSLCWRDGRDAVALPQLLAGHEPAGPAAQNTEAEGGRGGPRAGAAQWRIVQVHVRLRQHRTALCNDIAAHAGATCAAAWRSRLSSTRARFVDRP